MEVLSSRVIIRAGDFAAQRRFYEDVVGLRIYREYGRDGTASGVVYFLGGGFLEVTDGGGGDAAPPITLWLQVADVAGEAERLAAAAVEVRRPAGRMPWGLVEAWFGDPEGHELRLVEVPPDHPLRSRLD